jgi:hypothetical protein
VREGGLAENFDTEISKNKSTVDNFRNCDCIRGMIEDAELKQQHM